MGTLGPGIVTLVPGDTDSIGDEPELLSTARAVGFGCTGVLRTRKQKCIVMGYRESMNTRQALGVLLEET